jgi:tetratricopeptide (TPR) repeat protein
VYERAVTNLPPGNEKRYWQRYIYLWIKYALWEELEAGEPDRAREVYRTCLKLIPHQQFTFGKVWVMAAQLEVRERRLDAARKILGMAVGLAPKDKTFKAYIEMEFTMGGWRAAGRGAARVLAAREGGVGWGGRSGRVACLAGNAPTTPAAAGSPAGANFCKRPAPAPGPSTPAAPAPAPHLPPHNACPTTPAPLPA